MRTYEGIFLFFPFFYLCCFCFWCCMKPFFFSALSQNKTKHNFVQKTKKQKLKSFEANELIVKSVEEMCTTLSAACHSAHRQSYCKNIYYISCDSRWLRCFYEKCFNAFALHEYTVLHFCNFFCALCFRT